jgi:hypothetical protein
VSQSLLVQAEDGSLETTDGATLHFSVERFRSVICDASACFLCGAAASSRDFNDEHIFPRWLLEDLGLFNTKITLPNGTLMRYGQYVIPCCQQCNSRLGAEVEGPVSQILRGGFSAVKKHIEEQGPSLLYTWLSLIYLKTHLKDRDLRQHLDRRKPPDSIATVHEYDWPRFHHAYCVARSRFYGIAVEPEAIGSFMIFELAKDDGFPRYDYRDFLTAQSALIRVRDVALVAVFDDSSAALSNRYDFFSGFTGPLSAVQLREVLTHLSYTNLALAERPQFFTHVGRERISICAKRPEQIRLEPFDELLFGKMLYSSVEDYLPYVRAVGVEDVGAAVRAGKFSFLYYANREFIRNSVTPAE